MHGNSQIPDPVVRPCPGSVESEQAMPLLPTAIDLLVLPILLEIAAHHWRFR